jgi:hypothetical protein
VLISFSSFTSLAGRRLTHRSTVHTRVAVTHSFEPAGSDAHGRHVAWLPNQGFDARRRQLGGRACQAGPPPGFRAGQLESTKASIERLQSGEHVVNNGAELLGDERARDRFSFPPHEATILRLDFGEVLRGPDRGMVKRQLEVAIPIARPLVPSGSHRSCSPPARADNTSETAARWGIG